MLTHIFKIIDKIKARGDFVQKKYNYRLNTIKGVNRFLQRIIIDLANDNITESKARALGYLCNIRLLGFEKEDIEQRLTELEKRFNDEY